MLGTSPARVRVPLWVRTVLILAHSRLEMAQFLCQQTDSGIRIRKQCVCSGRRVKRAQC